MLPIYNQFVCTLNIPTKIKISDLDSNSLNSQVESYTTDENFRVQNIKPIPTSSEIDIPSSATTEVFFIPEISMQNMNNFYQKFLQHFLSLPKNIFRYYLSLALCVCVCLCESIHTVQPRDLKLWYTIPYVNI